MIGCFAHLQMFRYPPLRRTPFSSADFEKEYLRKHGRPYYKPYEEGDEEIRILPRRGYKDTMTYQKYTKTVDSRVHLTPCCTYGGVYMRAMRATEYHPIP